MSSPATPAPKPQEGSVAPVQVVNIWKHPLVLLMAAIASVPLVLATLVQLHQIPGLPTNVATWIDSGIAILTVVVTVLRGLGLLGQPVISPTAAAKLIQTDAPQ